MSSRHVVILGAGEVGYHLAKTLVDQNLRVSIIDSNPDLRASYEERLDVSFFVGNGTNIPVLREAGVQNCELFIAAADNEEVNLVSSAMAKDLGAERCVVRLENPDDLSIYRAEYERLFGADLLLSPQYLATIEIENLVLGHNTHEIDFFAHGTMQLRTIEIQPGCELTKRTLREARLPADSLIVGYLDADHELAIPEPDQVPKAGGRAIVLCSAEQIHKVEMLCSAERERHSFIVIAGGGLMGRAVAAALLEQVRHVMVLERDRGRAERVANEFPSLDVVCADATDVPLLKSLRVPSADCFLAALGNDEANLMAALVAHELGADKVIATVRRTETTKLWERAGTFHAVSPRYLAAERITRYIENGYKSNLTTLAGGALHLVQRQIFDASPVAGVALKDMGAPQGLMVGVLQRGSHAWIPQANDKMLPGDRALLFVHDAEISTVNLFFPGDDRVLD